MKNFATLILVTIFLSACAETVYIHGAKISSTDINGTKKFGPKSAARVSKLIKDPVLAEPEHEYLGRLISSDHVRTDNGFFDYIFRKGDYGVLDSVYINFLEEVSIPNIDPRPEGFNAFKTEFNDASNYKEKKNVLFKEEYKGIRAILEKSIYREISNEIIQKQRIEQVFKAGIDSNIKAALKEKDIELTGDLNAQLENMVKSNVTIEGRYVDIELVKEFNDNLIDLLNQLKASPPSPDNAFARNYLERFLGNKDFVSVGYSLLQFDINYKTSNITKSDIEAILDGVATLSETDRVNLSAKVYSSFSLSKDFSGESRSSKNYLVRYAYNNSMQEYVNQ